MAVTVIGHKVDTWAP